MIFIVTLSIMKSYTGVITFNNVVDVVGELMSQLGRRIYCSTVIVWRWCGYLHLVDWLPAEDAELFT